MNAHDFITEALAEKGQFDSVYWVACGGSVIDLYPAHCLVQHESATLTSGFYTAAEFNLYPPKKLNGKTLVVLCSHSGNTPEVAEAGDISSAAGATVLALTDTAGSRIDQERWATWVYPWGEDIPQAEVPIGITLKVAAELIRAQEGLGIFDDLMAGIAAIDDVLIGARQKVNTELGERFARLCQEHDFLYILGSGPNYCQTYGMAICSLMEMQWQHCCYLNSAEYFHGPFECTEPGVFYFLQLGSGAARSMDERALAFLKEHTDALMVLDAQEYGMDAIPQAARDYLDPALFYAMNVELRAARGKAFDHDPDIRRYMGVVAY